MTTSTTSFSLEDTLDSIANHSDESSYIVHGSNPDKSKSPFVFLSKWFLRLACIFIFIVCPWANYKLIEFFQKRLFYKESSAKWYIIFKGVFDTIYMLISVPIIFCLTFNIDIIHRSIFTCRSITYIHYLSDDLISMMLTLLCLDRMIRITFSYRLHKRFSLIICIIATIFFFILNIHHILRLQHSDGFCHKDYFSIWDYDFDIYYSVVYTSITWTIIFISSINLSVSVYCDRARSNKLKKQQQTQQQQQQTTNKFFSNGGNSMGGDSDRLELIHSTGNQTDFDRRKKKEIFFFIDDWEDSASVVIEQNPLDNKYSEQEQQDNIDLQLTVCVLITSAIFLGCNLPNFIMFIMRFVYHSGFNTIGYIFVYISLFPLLIAHTISYFVFNHLAARLFPNNSS
jgi:hypothetical protein